MIRRAEAALAGHRTSAWRYGTRRLGAPALAALTLAASAAIPQPASAQIAMEEQLFGLCEWYRGLPGCTAAPKPEVPEKSNYQKGKAHSTMLGQPGYPVVP
jgi:hypothetical protein